jgi:hypothetical protein
MTYGPAKVTFGSRTGVMEYVAITRSTVPFCRKLSRLADTASLNSMFFSSVTPSFLAMYFATSTSKPSGPLGPLMPMAGWSYLTPMTSLPLLAFAATPPAEAPGLEPDPVSDFLAQPVMTRLAVATAASARP